MAVAVTAVLALGVGAASATRLCKEEGNARKECPAGQVWLAETPLKFVQQGKSLFKIGLANVECTGSTWTGETIGAGGGAGVVVPGGVENAAWECNCPTAAINTPWGVKFSGAGNRDGTMTYQVAVEFNCAGVVCKYKGEPKTSVKGGKPASFEISAELAKSEGGFACANPAIWTATYEIAEPFPMFITEA
ncbi:MAG: hypothetical protein ACTHNP_13405 [Solirubrobacterales bacterium]